MRTYGRVVYEGTQWLIDAEPQVALRLKRVFGKIAKGRQGTLALLDTIDSARDLAWFLERYPMEMRDADRAHLMARDQQHRTLAADVGRILAGDYKPRDFKLALPLRQYQSVAADLTLSTKRLLLADDVGVGKTGAAIGVLSDPACRPALVVTLTHLPRQFKAELERFLPGIRVHILKKGTPYDITAVGRRRRSAGQSDMFESAWPDIVISNYQKLNGWAGELAGKVKAVVFDEAHELRRTGSDKYNAAKAIADRAEVRLGMTATPIFNYAGEVHAICDVLSPGALGTWEEFSTEWCGAYSQREKAVIKDVKALGSSLRESGLMLRRTRAEVGRELPALSIIPHVIDLDTTELDKIESVAAELAKTILRQGGGGLEKMRAAEELSWRLRQATGIAKAAFVADFVRMLVEAGEKVLLGAWHREVYSIIGERLKNLGVVFFTGEESIPQKEAAKAAFVDGDAKVLMMSLRAGAGIDGLQKVCRNVVYAEPDWSPSVHEQFTGRVYRDGQVDPVAAYFLLADSGSDPVIADVLGLKRAQLEGIRDPTADIVQAGQTDPERVRRLAEDFLRQRGIAVPEPEQEDAA